MTRSLLRPWVFLRVLLSGTLELVFHDERLSLSALAVRLAVRLGPKAPWRDIGVAVSFVVSLLIYAALVYGFVQWTDSPKPPKYDERGQPNAAYYCGDVPVAERC